MISTNLLLSLRLVTGWSVDVIGVDLVVVVLWFRVFTIEAIDPAGGLGSWMFTSRRRHGVSLTERRQSFLMPGFNK